MFEREMNEIPSASGLTAYLHISVDIFSGY